MRRGNLLLVIKDLHSKPTAEQNKLFTINELLAPVKITLLRPDKKVTYSFRHEEMCDQSPAVYPNLSSGGYAWEETGKGALT